MMGSGLGFPGSRAQHENIPLTIAGGPVAYFDASVPSLVSIDTGVDQWTDLSGNGNHAVEATGSEQPAYAPATGVSFDGVDDLLTIATDASLDDIFATGGHCVFVGLFPTDGANARIFQQFDSGAGYDFQVSSVSASGGKFVFIATHSVTKGTWGTDNRDFNDDDYAIFELTYDGSSTSNDAAFTKNGVALASTETSTPDGTHDGSTGDVIVFGNNVTPSDPIKASFKAFLLYSSIPSATERAALRQFLGRKFGIPTA